MPGEVDFSAGFKKYGGARFLPLFVSFSMNGVLYGCR